MGVRTVTLGSRWRRGLAAVAIVTLASTALGVDARAQEDDPPDPSVLRRGRRLTSVGRVTGDKASSSALAEDRPGAAAAQRLPAGPGGDQARLRRRGRVRRRRGRARGHQPARHRAAVERTSGGGRSGTSATSRPQEAAFVAALRAAVPSAEIGTRLRTVYGGIAAIDPGQRGGDRARHRWGGGRAEERPAPAAHRLESGLRQRDRPSTTSSAPPTNAGAGPDPRQPRHRRVAGTSVVRGPRQPAGPRWTVP